MVLYHFKYGSVGIIFYYFKDIINYFKVISINWKMIDEKMDYIVGKYLLKKVFFWKRKIISRNPGLPHSFLLNLL